MKKLLLFLLVVLSGTFLLNAQNLINAENNSKMKLSIRKDTGYQRFESELKQLANKAKGGNANAVAIKKHFAQNASMLKKLYAKNKIGVVKPVAISTVAIQTPKILGEISRSKIIATKPRSYTPAYDNQFLGGFLIPSRCVEQGSNPATGKLGYRYDGIQETASSLGGNTASFTQKFQVPDDPLLVTARVEFQYSFMCTGWDTKNASFGIGLYILKPNNFNCPAFDALPLIKENPNPFVERWRRVKNLTPQYNITEDFRQFNHSMDGNFIIEGYITPGSELNFRIDAGYRLEDTDGLYGAYHYGEFKLKKIIITYYRAG